MRRTILVPAFSMSTLLTIAACGQLPLNQNQTAATVSSSPLSAAAVQYLTDAGLSQTGSPDGADNFVKDQGLASRLSDANRAIFDKVKALLDANRAEKEKICPRESELRTTLATQLKAIHDNSTLSYDEKKAQIEALITSNQAAIATDRQAFQSCVAAHQDELKVLNDKKDSIVQACGLPSKDEKGKERIGLDKGGDRKHGGERHGAQSRPESDPSSTSQQIPSEHGDRFLDKELVLLNLEQGLNSSACAAVLPAQ